jgi:hypothetical protein
MAKYALEQWTFLYDSYVKKHPSVRVPALSIILELANKVCSTGSFFDRIYTR